MTQQATPKEVYLFLDATTPGVPTLHEATRVFVTHYTEARKTIEKSPQSGVRAIALVKTAMENFHDLGRLTPHNLTQAWNAIPQGTQMEILPAWTHAMQEIKKQHAHEDFLPEMVFIVALHSTPTDQKEFLNMLGTAPKSIQTEIAIVGQENASLVHTYQQLAKQHRGQISVTSLVGETDAQKIAQQLLTAVH